MTFSVWVGALYQVQVTPLIAYSLAIVTVIAGLLMVSNYRYFSFKEMHLKGTVPYVVFLSVVVVFVLIAQRPHETLLAMCVIYAASGPIGWIYRRQVRKPVAESHTDNALVNATVNVAADDETGTQSVSRAQAADATLKPMTETQNDGDSKQ